MVQGEGKQRKRRYKCDKHRQYNGRDRRKQDYKRIVQET